MSENDVVLPTIGEIIRKKRKMCGHSLRDTARLAGVSLSTPYRIEIGVPVAYEYLLRVCLLYRIDPMRWARRAYRGIRPAVKPG